MVRAIRNEVDELGGSLSNFVHFDCLFSSKFVKGNGIKIKENSLG